MGEHNKMCVDAKTTAIPQTRTLSSLRLYQLIAKGHYN